MTKFLLNGLKGREPLLIDPAKASDHAALAEKFGFTDMLAQLFGAAPEPYVLENGTGVIPIVGVIGKGLSPLERMMGSSDVDSVSEAIDKMAVNPAVERIAFHVSSPGGTVTGVEELANKIRGLKVPTMAYTDSEMASAAYWISSAADRVVASPSATVGSIGVYMAIPDFSKAAEMQGIKMVVIKSGKFKGDEFPAHAGRDVLVGRTGPELRSHVALDVAARLLDDPGHVGVVLDRQLLELEDIHLVLDGVDGMLEQRDATGAGSVLVVDDVHHRLRQDLAVRAVRAVDVKGNQFAVSAEDAAVMHTLGGRHVHRVADAVGLDELKFRVAVGVPHLGREGVAVPGHRPHEDTLHLGERKAVRDVDALGLLGEVRLVTISQRRVSRVGLGLDTVAHRI